MALCHSPLFQGYKKGYKKSYKKGYKNRKTEPQNFSALIGIT